MRAREGSAMAAAILESEALRILDIHALMTVSTALIRTE